MTNSQAPWFKWDITVGRLMFLSVEPIMRGLGVRVQPLALSWLRCNTTKKDMYANLLTSVTERCHASGQAYVPINGTLYDSGVKQ